MGYEFTHLRPNPPLKIKVGDRVYTGRTGPEIFKSFIRQSEFAQERLEPGWEDLVWETLRQAYPRYVRKTPKPLAYEQRPPSVVTLVSFVNFVRKRIGNRDLVGSEEAEARVVVCRECPSHRKISGCSACKAALKLLVKPPKLYGLQACGACGCYLDLKVWLPAHYLVGDVEKFPFPPNCWMHSLQVVELTQADLPTLEHNGLVHEDGSSGAC